MTTRVRRGEAPPEKTRSRNHGKTAHGNAVEQHKACGRKPKSGQTHSRNFDPRYLPGLMNFESVLLLALLFGVWCLLFIGGFCLELSWKRNYMILAIGENSFEIAKVIFQRLRSSLRREGQVVTRDRMFPWRFR